MTLKNLPSYTGTPCSGVLNNLTIRYISNCLSVCLAIRQSVCQFVCVCLSICLSVCAYLSVSQCLSFRQSTFLFACLYTRQSVSQSNFLFVSFSDDQSVYVYLHVLYLSACIYLSTFCFSIYRSIRFVFENIL